MGNRIREQRQARGWSIRELGERMGVHFTTVAKLERSERRLTYEWATRFAEVFGTSVQDVTDRVRGWDLVTTQTPVISELEAAEWRDAVQRTKSFVNIPPPEPRAFAILVEETDVVDRGTHNLIAPTGSHVLVDPDQSELHHGHYFAAIVGGATRYVRFLADPARLEPCSRDESHTELVLGRTAFTLIGRLLSVYTKLV